LSTAILEQLDFDSTLEDATGGNVKVFKSDYRGRGRFPVIDQGQDFIAGYVDSEDAVCQVELPVIVFGDHTCAFKFVDFPFVLGADGVKVLKPRPGFDAKFLYYWLCQLKLPDTGYDRHFKYLKRAKFPPRRSLDEQKRIAAILDKADAIRRRRQEAARLADTLMMSGFQHIVGPLAQGYRSWKRGTIESLASPEPGSMRTGPFGSDLRHSEFVSEGVAVLGIDNAVQNRFAWDERRFITHDKYEYLQRYTVKPSDVIVTIMGTTGRSAVVPHDIPLAITTKHLATITVNRKVAEPEFVSHSIYRHPEVLTQIANSHRGAIMPGLNLGLIRRLELPVPPPPVQQEFTRFVKSVRELEELHHTKQLAADDLFNSLVQRAFRGEL
jgi:type I restriction enzyme S subunit